MVAETNGDLIRTAERRAYVLQLRKAGATYRDIANACVGKYGWEGLPQGWDCRYAYKDVKRELDKLRADMALDAEAIRTMELERLDAVLLSVWALAVPTREAQVDTATRLAAVDRVLRIVQQRLRLVPDLGQPISLEGVTVQVIGGVDLDDL